MELLTRAYTTTVVKYAPVKYPLWGYLTLAFDDKIETTYRNAW
jgi:hypothetical protein